ncbi:MAG: hypothetical protein L0271_12760 [Gemmatimonadetes bacterium]|nr:hypothetical protein [Gemmatimonadota bacterium]
MDGRARHARHAVDEQRDIAVLVRDIRQLANPAIDRLFQDVAGTPGYKLTVDLEAQTLVTRGEHVIAFSLDASIKRRLMEGLNDIGITLQSAERIRAYEQRRRQDAPWLFSEEIRSAGQSL